MLSPIDWEIFVDNRIKKIGLINHAMKIDLVFNLGLSINFRDSISVQIAKV